MSVMERLTKILQVYLQNPDMEISPQADLLTDLGLNSFEVVQIISDIEEEFELGQEIPDEEIPNLRTVGQIEEYLKKNAGK